MPVTWFPDHRGKVIGFVMAGHGLAQTVFSPLQTLVVNPENIAPVSVREEIIVDITLDFKSQIDTLQSGALQWSAIMA